LIGFEMFGRWGLHYVNHVYIYKFICILISLCMCVCLPAGQSVFSISLYVSLYAYLSPCISISLSVFVSIKITLKLLVQLGSVKTAKGSCTVVQHSTTDCEVEGLNPARCQKMAKKTSYSFDWVWNVG
jgi:hypothetical protein